jgi:hypothetical protein
LSGPSIRLREGIGCKGLGDAKAAALLALVSTPTRGKPLSKPQELRGLAASRNRLCKLIAALMVSSESNTKFLPHRYHGVS